MAMSEPEARKQYVKAFRNKRILLIGDAVIDQYLYGTTSRMSPDAPVPLIDVNQEQHSIGAFKTVVEYIIALGGIIEPITYVGNDFEGQYILKELGDLKVSLKGVKQIDGATPKITRIIAQNQQLLRLETKLIQTKAQNQILTKEIEEFIQTGIEKCDAIVILDYNMGTLNSILISQILTQANEAQKRIIVRPEDSKYYLYHNVHLVVMNRPIASKAIGVQPMNETSIRIMGNKILNELHAEGVYIPWIEGDSYYFQQNGVQMIPSLLKIPPVNVTQIGSALVAVAGLMEATGGSLPDVAHIAHYAGSLVAANHPLTNTSLESVITHGTLPTI